MKLLTSLLLFSAFVALVLAQRRGHGYQYRNRGNSYGYRRGGNRYRGNRYGSRYGSHYGSHGDGYRPGSGYGGYNHGSGYGCKRKISKNDLVMINVLFFVLRQKNRLPQTH